MNRILHKITENKKTTDQKAEGTRGDHWRDFWIQETKTGKKVAQLCDN